MDQLSLNETKRILPLGSDENHHIEESQYFFPGWSAIANVS